MAECFEDNLDDRIPDAGSWRGEWARCCPRTLIGPGVTVTPAAPLLPPAATVVTPPVRPAMVRPLDPALRRPDVADMEDTRLDELRHRLDKMNVVLEADTEDARAWAERGEVHRQLGKYDDAIADCTQAIQLDPNLAMAYASRGGAYRMKRDYDMAISDCTRAVQLDAANELAWYQRGESYRMKARLDKAIADFTEAIKLDARTTGRWGRAGRRISRRAITATRWRTSTRR